MNYLYPLFFLLFTICHIGTAQPKTIQPIWEIDTSSFAIGKSLPATYRGGIKQMPMNFLKDVKISMFSYSISFGNEKIYMNCCLTVNIDSVLLAMDKNFDSIIQETEVFRYTLNQYKDEKFALNFSVKMYDKIEAFFLLGSIKKTSIKINTPDSILNLNPICLQSKNYMRSSFFEGGEMYHIILMNSFPAIGIGRDFKYLVTKTRINESDFSKITNWSQYNDTLLINESEAIVPIRKTGETIGFNVFESNGLFGTFTGAKMPKITAVDLDNSIIQLPINRLGNFHLIEFWGTWCGPCIALYPKLKKLLNDNIENLTYTGIAGNDERGKVIRYIEKKPDIKRQIFEPDNNKAIVRLFKIDSYPTFILVDGNGKIVAREYGSTGFEAIEKLINEEKHNKQSH